MNKRNRTNEQERTRISKKEWTKKKKKILMRKIQSEWWRKNDGERTIEKVTKDKERMRNNKLGRTNQENRIRREEKKVEVPIKRNNEWTNKEERTLKYERELY